MLRDETRRVLFKRDAGKGSSAFVLYGAIEHYVFRWVGHVQTP